LGDSELVVLPSQIYYYNYLGSKRNPDILKMLLMNQPNFGIPLTENSLTLGNRNASIKITAFLRLHCSHCARVFEQISSILREKANQYCSIDI